MADDIADDMAGVAIVDPAAAAGALVARHVAALVRVGPAFALGVATGSTPLPVSPRWPVSVRRASTCRADPPSHPTCTPGCPSSTRRAGVA